MFYEDLMIDYHAMECQPITLSSEKSFRPDRILDYLDACFWADAIQMPGSSSTSVVGMRHLA